MLVLKKVAITGGLACGKTSVARILNNLGASIVSADEIVHRLLSPQSEIGQQVVKLVGPEIIVNGTIDRQIIAKRVFNQPKLLKSLEGILHPAVRTQILDAYEQAKKDGKYKLFVAEIPLLFESGMEELFDVTIAVKADAAKCRERFGRPEEYDQRMARQLNPEEKARRADYTIENNGTFKDLEKQVKHIFNQLQQ